MALALKPSGFLQFNKKPEIHLLLSFHSRKTIVSTKIFKPMATLTTAPAFGLSETFTRLKSQGKVCTFLLSIILLLVFMPGQLLPNGFYVFIDIF